MQQYNNKHYITIQDGLIVGGWSDGPHRDRVPTEADILLTDKGGYQFRLILTVAELDIGPVHIRTEENPALYTHDHIPLYRWDGEKVIQRTEEEIEADRAAMREAQAQAEQERIANATETVLLEMVAEQEERICLLEMGVSENDL